MSTLRLTPEYDPEKPQEALDAERDPDNAANEYAIAAKKRRREHEQAKEAIGLKNIMASRESAAWLEYLLFDICGLMAPTENAAFDTNALHFKEGARNVALLVQDQCINADAGLYVAMLQRRMVKEPRK